MKERVRNKGVALMLVMGAITLLTAVLATFTFERKVDEKRAYNLQDRLQARLNAEAGLSLAMVRLQLYQMVLNLYEKNKDKIGQFITKQQLNVIWNLPFVYPIPLDKKGADAIQKAALAEFEKNSILQGGMSVMIGNISQLMNINILRLKTKMDDENKDVITNPDLKDVDINDPKEPILNFRKKLSDLIQQKLNEQKEVDENFESHYPTDTPEFMVKCIQYFVSDENSMEDPEVGEIERRFQDKEIQPKFAPMSSLSELYLVPCLNDAVINLIRDHVTVHGQQSLDLNKLTETNLKMLFPDIRPEQVKAFFEYRDDPKKGHPFNSLDEFKNYIVDDAQIVDKETFEKVIEEYQKAGIAFGPSGSLFKITSVGKLNDTTYSLMATVSIPIKEQKRPKFVKKKEDKTCPPGYEPYDKKPELCILKSLNKKRSPDEISTEETMQEPTDPNDPNNPPKAEEKEGKLGPTEYLEPRILELDVS